MNGKQFVETVLRVTGEDTVTVQQKNRKDWVGKLGTRMIFLSNVMPTLPDASGAIVSRMLPIWMPTSFFGREDHELGAKLAAELPGILNWALGGLDRLTKQGKFTELTSSAGLIEEIRDSASPIMAFLAEKCGTVPKRSIDKQVLYLAWCGWCSQTGHEPGSKESLTKKLVAALGRDVINPDAKVRQGNQKRVRVYHGIDLLPPSATWGTK